MSVPKIITIGPFPPAFLDRLTGPLKNAKVEFEVLTSEEHLKAYRDERKGKITHLAGYTAHDSLYLQVAFEHIMLIRNEVEKLGFPLKESDFDPGFDEREYLCPECDYHAFAPGLCPRHRIPLLEFSEYVAQQKEGCIAWGRWWKPALVLIIAIAAAVYVYEVFFAPATTLHR